jgi:carboxyl-terminal processing protease
MFKIRRFQFKSLLILALAASLALAVIAGCQGRPGASTGSGPEQVVWEGWSIINNSYVDTNSLDSEQVAGDIIVGMLDAAEKPHYPFLSDMSDFRGRPPRSVPEGFEDVWRAWQLFLQTWPEVDPAVLSDAALTSMMASLETGDRVSSYLNAEDYQRSQEDEREVSYQGVGAVMSMEDGRLTIVSLMSDAPAARAGLQRNDVILEVDGVPVGESEISEATSNIRGPSGSRVTFLIQRPNETEPREVSITRGNVNVPTVDMSLLPSSVGYMYIQAFYDHTIDEVLDVLETFNELETLGMVLDLRSNQTGSLELARDVAAQFVSNGLFAYQVDNEQVRTDLHLQEGEGSGVLDREVKLVVLVNQGTAEAAEALAGALQDAGRGVVMGDPTRGRGSTNSYVTLSNGGALYFPTSYWFTPSGRAISGEGILPDIAASLSQEDLIMNRDSQLQRAYEYLDQSLPAFR